VVAIALFGLKQYNNGCHCDENPDLSNKIVIITGGNSGIGYETSLALARRKAHVIIACRDLPQCQITSKQISQLTSNPKVESMALNLASFKSIRQFASDFQRRSLPIHILINNAGVWMAPGNRSFTEDGIEMTFGVNHLGHFLLTNLLLPQIKQGKARVVTVSSALHRNGVIDFENLQSEKSYGHMQTYSNSKLENVLFSNELNRLLDGTGAYATSLHPGVIRTQLHREMNDLMKMGYYVIGLFLKDVEFGAQTTIAASISKKFENKGGVYLAECEVAEPNPIALDKGVAKKLWEVSNKMVGLN